MIHVDVIYADQIAIDHRYHKVICVAAFYHVYDALSRDEIDELVELMQLLSVIGI